MQKRQPRGSTNLLQQPLQDRAFLSGHPSKFQSCPSRSFLFPCYGTGWNVVPSAKTRCTNPYIILSLSGKSDSQVYVFRQSFVSRLWGTQGEWQNHYIQCHLKKFQFFIWLKWPSLITTSTLSDMVFNIVCHALKVEDTVQIIKDQIDTLHPSVQHHCCWIVTGPFFNPKGGELIWKSPEDKWRQFSLHLRHESRLWNYPLPVYIVYNTLALPTKARQFFIQSIRYRSRIVDEFHLG